MGASKRFVEIMYSIEAVKTRIFYIITIFFTSLNESSPKRNTWRNVGVVFEVG